MRLDVLFSILLILNTVDYYLTLYNVNYKGAGEANLLLSSVVQNGLVFMLVKVVLVTATLVLALKLLQKILSKMNIKERIKNERVVKAVSYMVIAVYIVTVLNNTVVAVNAEEILIDNGDFEQHGSGLYTYIDNFYRWIEDFGQNYMHFGIKASNIAYSGNTSCKMYFESVEGHDGTVVLAIVYNQPLNFTKIKYVSFYLNIPKLIIESNGVDYGFIVYLNEGGDYIYESKYDTILYKINTTTNGWERIILDVSNITGEHHIGFQFYAIPLSSGYKAGECYIDHVTVLDSLPVVQTTKVVFRFKDAATGYYLSGVNFTINGESYTVNNGELQLNLTMGQEYVYTAEKVGYYIAEGNITIPSPDSEDVNLNGIPDVIELQLGTFDPTIYVDVFLTPVVTPPDPENQTVVHFNVKDQYGFPISGANVILSGVVKQTNDQGYTYFIVDKNKTYSYYVFKTGWNGVNGTVCVGSDPIAVEITLNPVLSNPHKDNDFDHDGIPDSKDSDDDNDGVLDVLDPAPYDPNVPNSNYPYPTNPNIGTPVSYPTYQTITSGYTPPNPELREVAKQTLNNWYQQIPSFFNLIFLLFFMATLTRVFPRRRR